MWKCIGTLLVAEVTPLDSLKLPVRVDQKRISNLMLITHKNLRSWDGYSVELRAELFNVLNSQTGYNLRSRVNSAGFGTPATLFNPRRLQLTAKAKF